MWTVTEGRRFTQQVHQPDAPRRMTANDATARFRAELPRSPTRPKWPPHCPRRAHEGSLAVLTQSGSRGSISLDQLPTTDKSRQQSITGFDEAMRFDVGRKLSRVDG
jgi:hypothetical protein